MYYVNKIISFMLNPLIVLFAGLGVAGLARACCSKFNVRRAWVRRLPAGIAGLSLAFIWFMSSGIAVRLIGRPLEVDEIALETLPQADAIVLLGGGMGRHEKCGRPEMFASADRVWAAAQLYKAGKAPVVFVTGTNNLAATSGLLADFGVPTNALRSVAGARNTEEEAKGIVGLSKILLVTSAWHMKRAKMMFEKYAQGVEVIAAPTDYEMHGVTEGPIRFSDFLPSADALFRNSYALKEWVARIGYAVFR